MNRRQRRAYPDVAAKEKAYMAEHPETFGPTYRVSIDAMLPKDSLWGREVAYHPPERQIVGRTPDAMWQAAMLAIMELLGMEDDKWLYGLLLNLINNFPEDARYRFLSGIINGAGMTIKAGAGEMVVEVLDGTFPPLSVNPQTGKLERKTKSGLILPSAADLVVPA